MYSAQIFHPLGVHELEELFSGPRTASVNHGRSMPYQESLMQQLTLYTRYGVPLRLQTVLMKPKVRIASTRSSEMVAEQDQVKIHFEVTVGVAPPRGLRLLRFLL
jgi:hypothetical protein